MYRQFAVLIPLILALSACSGGTSLGSSSPRTSATASSAPRASSSETAPPPSGTADAAQAAIQQVITRGNAEQQQALQAQDPSVMQDTSTASYYQDMAQGIRDMIGSGITSIKLLNLRWGPVSVNGSTAMATTYETWRTQFSDGTVDQSEDRNVYQLVDQGGAWKIAADAHPDTGFGVPPTPSGSASPSGSAAPVPPVPASLSGQHVSRNWAGYAAVGSGFTGVSATWTVPQLTPTGRPAADATWVGIGGVTARDLIQAGTEHTVLDTKVEYSAWIEMLPQVSHPVSLEIRPNDSVTVSIAQGQAGSWTVAFKDNTTGATANRSIQYQSSLSSAEWIEEAPSMARGGVLPLDNFGSVTFSRAGAVQKGKSSTPGALGASAITMISLRGQPLATASSLQANGTSFSVKRTSVPASAPGLSSAAGGPAAPGASSAP